MLFGSRVWVFFGSGVVAFEDGLQARDGQGFGFGVGFGFALGFRGWARVRGWLGVRDGLGHWGAGEGVWEGGWLHGHMFKIGGFVSEMFLMKCGVVGSARKVFDEMLVRDVVSGTSLIVTYAMCGAMESAIELFDELDVKDTVGWTAMISSYAQNARPKEALETFEKMQNEFILASVISACAQLGTAKYSMCIMDIVERSGHGPDKNVVIGSALVDMYAKWGRLDGAYKIFKVMKERNVYTYSIAIIVENV
ncbi:hypothetical protein RDABS01_016554 [Bienertia sinuspersici]